MQPIYTLEELLKVIACPISTLPTSFVLKLSPTLRFLCLVSGSKIQVQEALGDDSPIVGKVIPFDEMVDTFQWMVDLKKPSVLVFTLADLQTLQNNFKRNPITANVEIIRDGDAEVAQLGTSEGFITAIKHQGKTGVVSVKVYPDGQVSLSAEAKTEVYRLDKILSEMITVMAETFAQLKVLTPTVLEEIDDLVLTELPARFASTCSGERVSVSNRYLSVTDKNGFICQLTVTPDNVISAIEGNTGLLALGVMVMFSALTTATKNYSITLPLVALLATDE